MKRKTRIFSLIMAFALLLTAIVPGFIQGENATTTVNAANFVYSTFMRVVISDGARIRSGPGTSYSQIGYAYQGAILRWVSTDTGETADGSNQWYKIYYKGKGGSGVQYGWISAAHSRLDSAKPAGVADIKKCVFVRSEATEDDNIYIVGSIASPITGWYPIFMTSGGETFVALYQTYYPFSSSSTYPCAVGLPVATGADGDYTYYYFQNSTSSTTYSRLGYSTGSWNVTISKTSVYQRYWPSTKVGYEGQYTKNAQYPSTVRVYNKGEGYWWYRVDIDSSSATFYVWVRSDCCTVS